MAALFCDEDDEQLEIGINKDYATKYDSWRQKEELQKLKDRYGDGTTLGNLDEDSSSSEEEDESAKELTQQLEKDFFKTLSYLKKKDPCIYDENVNFFKKEYVADNTKEIKSMPRKDDKPLFLRDYERKIITERSGQLSDEEDDKVSRNKLFAHPSSPTLIEEQEEIQRSFKEALQDDDNDDNAWGGLFEKRKKTSEELKKENEDFREWLKGQHVQLKDKNTESDLKHLHDFWNDPKLDSSELFLKDYILNKKFLEPEDKNHIPTYDDIVHDSDEGLSEDEATIAKQEEFEHKFNFRFEEPDQEFIKRFPRTMENSMRKKDARRKHKRDEAKERKKAQKERMKEDLKRLKALKRKEIMDRIEKLKQVTGNASFGFQKVDLDGDFDPDTYDKRMSELFAEDFYGQEDNEEKPEFPDIDEELELEKWDDWNGNNSEANKNYGDYEPHCEDPDFNMDCDFNPTAQFQTEIIESTKGRKKNKKSKLAQALSRKKPIFDPSDQTFEQYVDEYYGLDYEDVIGDLPCRFKYRKVMPSSFGLTIEEILKANDKELNQWCSLKKAVQHRPYYIEKQDVERFEKKSRNENYKKKILTSLYQDEQQDSEEVKKVKKKKAKKHKKCKNKIAVINDVQEADQRILDTCKINLAVNELVSMNQADQKSNKKLNTSREHEKRDNAQMMVVMTSFDEHSKSWSEQLKIKRTDISNKRKMDQEEDADEMKNSTVKKAKFSKSTVEPLTCDDKIITKKKKKKRTPINESIKTISSTSSRANVVNDNTLSRRKKKNKKLSLKKITNGCGSTNSLNTKTNTKPNVPIVHGHKKKVGLIHKNSENNSGELSISDARLAAYGLNPKKFKNYLKYGKTEK